MSDVLELLARANPIPETRRPELEARALALADSWRSRAAAAAETSPRRRWRLAVVALLGLFVLVGVGTALALERHWLDFSKAEPAPPDVVTEFADENTMAPPGMGPDVLAKEARRIPVVDNKGKTWTFWVAPTRHGGYCVDVVAVGGGCAKFGTMPLSTISGVDGRRPPDPRIRTMIYGAANARWVDSLLIRFADGDTAQVPVTWVSKPIGFGFFYYDVPAEHRVGGHEPTKTEALDAAGNVVTESYEDEAKQPIPPADAIQDEKTAVARAQTADGEAILWRAPSRYGTTCSWIQLGDRVHMIGCVLARYSKEWGPEFTLWPMRRSVVVGGQVDPRFKRVELQFADYSRVSAKLVDGYLLYSIPPAHLVPAKQLVAIRLDNADGSAAFEQELTLGLSGCNAPLPTTETCRLPLSG
jgi:hypothetical protein